MTQSPALAGLKVLDLSHRYAHYCGKLFADMGADVVLVEKPGGGALRSEAPFIGDRDDPEYGIPFFYFNTSKRGVTLDLGQAEGRELFRKLAAEADLVIEDGAPGALDALGVGYDALAAMRPQLVMTCITPFGQTGPYANYAADDLTLLAMGGFLHMMGYPDAAPTQAYGNQAYAMANMFAVVGSMIAVLGAQASGQGQRVDISIQECVTMALENAAQFYDLEKRVRTRFAGSQRQAGTGIFECADGSVYIFAGGMAAIRFWGHLVQWMKDERVPSFETLDDPQWSNMAFLNSDPAKDTFGKMFSVVARGKTKEALYREAQRRRVPLCPVSTMADVAQNRQLAYRGFFTRVPHAPSASEIVMPGAPFVMSETPSKVSRPAPKLGQHNREIYAAIGVGEQKLAALERAGGRMTPPLSGIRVADFCWIGAGSYTTKLLADFGAEVIKVESSTRMDSLRSTAPFKDGVAGINRSGYFADRNTSKRGIRLNLKHPKAPEIARALIAKSDVVANNFTPGTMEKFGLGYKDVITFKRDIIYISMSMQGAAGPDSKYVGFGLTIAALSGLQYLSGQADRQPAGTGTNYPDHVPNPAHGAFAVLCALYHKRRTGEGQFIDLAQTEPTIALLGPALVDYTVNGRVAERCGNDHWWAAPRGAYPCQGPDRWIAISIYTDAQWRSLVDVLGPIAGERDWSDRAVRREHKKELDGLIGARTAPREARELMTALQARNVPSGVVQNSKDLLEEDAQLAHRQHWISLEHKEMGTTLYNAPPVRLSRTPATLSRPAPLLGEHTEEVCLETLGMTRSQFDELRAAGVFE